MTTKLGTIWLTTNESAQKPISNEKVDSWTCWTDPNVKGIAARSKFIRIHPDAATFYWTFFDKIAANCLKYGKKFSFLITSAETPTWVFDAGAKYINIAGESGPLQVALPWDKIFQSKWCALLSAFATRYGSNPLLAYVVMSGYSRRAEFFFCTNTTEQDIMDSMARTAGFVDGMDGLKTGAETIIDMYAARFPRVSLIFDLGTPSPDEAAGVATTTAICDWGSTKYPSRFGVKSDGLGPNGPPNGSLGMTEVKKLSTTALCGYQMTLPEDNATKLTTALNRGIDNGAAFVEVYPPDIMGYPAVIEAANKRWES